MKHLGISLRLYFSFTFFLFLICMDNEIALSWGRSQTRPSLYVYQEVLVQYRPEATIADIGGTYSNLGLQEVSYSLYSGLRRVRVLTPSSVYTVSASLNQNPLINYAEPNFVRSANFVPNDPLYKYQWHLNNPMMQRTWDLSVGINVLVAVLDTGISYRNGGGFGLAPDLADTTFTAGYDFVNDDPYPDDDNRHGTHIAGIIAQSTNNLYGGAGVAPGCTLMPVKVLDKTGAGEVIDIVDAIYYAVNNGAQIINMSYGFVTSPSASEEEAINYAVSQGVTIVCSAGNEATNEPHYPSSYDATISVTATRYDQSFASSYSNYGPDTDICAPGGDLDQDVNSDGYPDGIYQQTHNGTDYKEFEFYFAEGTSCAAAFVSGVVALMIARAGRTLTPAQVREILHNTATDLGDSGWDPFYGWGLVNPLAAVQSAATYTTAGYFVPGAITQSAPLNTTYQAQSTIRGINSGVASSNNSIYQSNAGFVSIGGSLQGALDYQRLALFPFVNGSASLTAGLGIYTGAFNLLPIVSIGDLSSIYQSVLQGSYSTASSNGYQNEAGFAPSYGYRGLITPFTNTTATWPFIPNPLFLFARAF